MALQAQSSTHIPHATQRLLRGRCERLRETAFRWAFIRERQKTTEGNRSRQKTTAGDRGRQTTNQQPASTNRRPATTIQRKALLKW
jgi:hypothetical protein